MRPLDRLAWTTAALGALAASCGAAETQWVRPSLPEGSPAGVAPYALLRTTRPVAASCVESPPPHAPAELDPAGDGSLRAVEGPRGTELVSVTAGVAPVRLDVTLAHSADPSVVRLGPVRVDDDGRPDLVGVRYTQRGDASFGGMGMTRYEIVLLGPGGAGPERVVRRFGEIHGEGQVSVGLVDLDGDGRHELLVNERSSYMNCDWSTGGGGSSRWLLLDGEGATLWQDEARDFSFGGRSAAHREVSARVVDVAGDGTRALRLRSAREVWYVLPTRSAAPAVIPPCVP